MKTWITRRERLVPILARRRRARGLAPRASLVASDHQDTPLVELTRASTSTTSTRSPRATIRPASCSCSARRSPLTPAQTPSCDVRHEGPGAVPDQDRQHRRRARRPRLPDHVHRQAGKQKVTLRGPVRAEERRRTATRSSAESRSRAHRTRCSATRAASSCSPARATIRSSSISRSSSASSPTAARRPDRCRLITQGRSTFRAPRAAPWTSSAASTTSRSSIELPTSMIRERHATTAASACGAPPAARAN